MVERYAKMYEENEAREKVAREQKYDKMFKRLSKEAMTTKQLGWTKYPDSIFLIYERQAEIQGRYKLKRGNISKDEWVVWAELLEPEKSKSWIKKAIIRGD